MLAPTCVHGVQRLMVVDDLVAFVKVYVEVCEKCIKKRQKELPLPIWQTTLIGRKESLR